jgi:flagellar motor component MotA
MKGGNLKPDINPGGGYKQAAVVLLICLAIYLYGGLDGFKPLFSVESALLVFGGTFLLAWAAYPLGELLRPSGPAPMTYAAGRAAAMGLLTAVLGVILTLSSITDISQAPRRLGFALSGLFFGLLLSEVLLAPRAARLAAARDSGADPAAGGGQGRRFFLGLLGLGAALFGALALLYSLAAAL